MMMRLRRTHEALLSLVFVFAFAGVASITGCTTTFTEMQKKPPAGTIHLEGDYKSAAHCFYYAIRESNDRELPKSGRLEFPLGKDYAEWLYFDELKGPSMLAIISDTPEGDSSATVYIKNLLRSYYFRKIETATESCQVRTSKKE